MSNNCKDCDRLQIKQYGTAPERPAFQQPTMYDHFGNFQKFKQAKEEEQFLKQRQEELLKFNSNFTNFHLNDVAGKHNFEHFSTQDLAKFRNKQRLGSYDRVFAEKSVNKEEDIAINSLVIKNNPGSNEKSLQKHKSLVNLTRTPVQCPITTCNRTIGNSSVLSHYLQDHNEEFGVQFQEIYKGKRSVLIFDPTILNFNENICLGILAYGGTADDSSSRPVERGLCKHNAFLPKSHESLDAHLPIVIMACRTSWSILLANKVPEANPTDCNYLSQELLVLWLTSVETTKPIHCTMTAYDKLMSSSRSAILKLRSLNDSQNPKEFLLNDTQFIRLSHGEINILSQDRKEHIHLEIMINEYED